MKTKIVTIFVLIFSISMGFALFLMGWTDWWFPPISALSSTFLFYIIFNFIEKKERKKVENAKEVSGLNLEESKEPPKINQ